MADKSEREVIILNVVLLLMSVLSLAAVAYLVVVDRFRSGIDFLFGVMVGLFLALVFALQPAVWAYQKGWLRNPLKRRAAKPARDAVESAD